MVVDRALADAEIGGDVLAGVSDKHRVQDLAPDDWSDSQRMSPRFPAICIALPRPASDRAPAGRERRSRPPAEAPRTKDGENRSSRALAMRLSLTVAESGRTVVAFVVFFREPSFYEGNAGGPTSSYHKHCTGTTRAG
jgi:hypothetical protein